MVLMGHCKDRTNVMSNRINLPVPGSITDPTAVPIRDFIFWSIIGPISSYMRIVGQVILMSLQVNLKKDFD